MEKIAAPSRPPYLRVYFALLALLALTAIAAQMPTGVWALLIALAIATAKLLLIFAFFMRLREHRGLPWLFAAAGFFWLGIALVLTFSDYLTRAWD